MGGSLVDKLLTLLTIALVYAVAGWIWFFPPKSSGLPGEPPAGAPAQSHTSSIMQAPGSAETGSFPQAATNPVNAKPPAGVSGASIAPASPAVTQPASAQPSPMGGPSSESSPPGPPSGPPRTIARYHVQVGAFRSREYAEDLVRQLRLHGFAGKIIKDGVYRVWVGETLERPAAEHMAADLESAGFETFLNPR